MIPGTYQCPAGLTREYYGYLMSGNHNNNHQYDFVCVDHEADPVPDSGASRNGALIFPVEAHCGALPCPPRYTQGKELTCAVCTKWINRWKQTSLAWMEKREDTKHK